MRAIATTVLILTLAVGTAASASAESSVWRPGQNYLITEEDAVDLLDDTYDQAYCQGIPRFGQRGEFPYEGYVVFDCTVEGTGYTCYDNRYKAIKAARRGWFKLKLLRRGECY